MPDARREHGPPNHRQARRTSRRRATSERAAAPPPHTWDVRLDDHDLTVILTGELDCLSAPALSAQLGHLLASHRPRRLVLDLAGVRFMDCAGLRPIVQARRALPADQPIVLRGPTGPVRRLLHIARTGEAWQIEDL